MTALSRNLRARRERRGWTQEELAEKCAISTRVYQRWEAGGVAKPHPAKLESVAKALGTTAQALFSNDEPQSAVWITANVTERIYGKSALLFDLNSARYKISRREQLEFAPFAIALLLELSLEWRRDQAANAKEASDAVCRAVSALGDHAQLGTSHLAQAISETERSVEAGDVFGTTLLDWDQGFSDEERENPFYAFVASCIERLESPVLGDSDGLSSISGLPTTEGLHADLLERLIGRNEYARAALEGGHVRLQKLPQGVVEADVEARAAWLEGHLPDELRHDIDELNQVLGQMFETDLNNSEGS